MKPDINKYSEFLLSWEGNYVNNKNDSGGPTKYGVTLETWKKLGYDKNNDGKIDAEDVKLITTIDATSVVLKESYWNKWLTDSIKCEWIAYLLVDWLWTSGKYGIIYPQIILGVKPDGVVGPKTINAINHCDPKTLFIKLWKRRYNYMLNISKQGSKNAEFRDGWLNRCNSITFGYLKTNKGKKLT